MTDKKIPSSLEVPESRLSRPATPEYLPPETLDPVIYRELLKIRATLEKIDGFPRGWCHLTAQQVAHELGLPTTGGHYHSPDSKLTYPHHWNTTHDGQYAIDLTHDQFDKKAPAVTILPANTPVLHERSYFAPLKKRPTDEG